VTLRITKAKRIHMASEGSLAMGNLYIADSGNGAIRRVATDGVISTVAKGDWTPARVAADADGNLFTADTRNHRVWRTPPGGLPVVIAGTGSPGYSGDGGPALSGQLDEPADVAVDGDGNIYIADLGNGLIRKLIPDAEEPPPVIPPPPIEQPETLEITNVVNSASLLTGPIAPGEIVTLYGSRLSGGATEVFFDGQPAAPLYVSEAQINVRAPSGGYKDSVTVEVQVDEEVVRAIVPGAAASPGIFTLAPGQAVALNADNSLNSTAQPAARGSQVTLYATGEGRDQPLAVWIAGRPAPIVFSESKDGILNLRVGIPGDCPQGSQAVLLRAGSAQSQPGVAIAIR